MESVAHQNHRLHRGLSEAARRRQDAFGQTLRRQEDGRICHSGFPVESLSKYIPEYQSVRPMEGGDDLEVSHQPASGQ